MEPSRREVRLGPARTVAHDVTTAVVHLVGLRGVGLDGVLATLDLAELAEDDDSDSGPALPPASLGWGGGAGR